MAAQGRQQRPYAALTEDELFRHVIVFDTKYLHREITNAVTGKTRCFDTRI